MQKYHNYPTKSREYQRLFLTGRLFSCSRSPSISTRAGNVGLSLGSPCQQANMIPYLLDHASRITYRIRKSSSRVTLDHHTLYITWNHHKCHSHLRGGIIWCPHSGTIFESFAEVFIDLKARVRRCTCQNVNHWCSFVCLCSCVFNAAVIWWRCFT